MRLLLQAGQSPKILAISDSPVWEFLQDEQCYAQVERTDVQQHAHRADEWPK